MYTYETYIILCLGVGFIVTTLFITRYDTKNLSLQDKAISRDPLNTTHEKNTVQDGVKLGKILQRNGKSKKISGFSEGPVILPPQRHCHVFQHSH